LHDDGRCPDPTTVHPFLEYPQVIFNDFSPKINFSLTFNQPSSIPFFSNLLRIHPPRNPHLQTSINVPHPLLL
ncbi:family 1 glycosylhydrolase, partial [Paenibacillus xylanexedens]|uniref:family 1 glycosylhydrolase n=1 Tax=Paenibacillus xylanexedens TaxID=528191 RepID=UPI0011A68B99